MAAAVSWVVAAGMATGFFQVVEQAGIWWLQAPDGSRFLSKGVCTTRYALDHNPLTRISTYGEAARAKYGNDDAWRAAVARRLMQWGFNTLGAWSDEKLADVEVEGRHLALAPTLDLGAKFVAHKLPGRQAWLHGIFPDVFDPQFPPFVHERARQQCAARREDRRVLGWFTDNELRWGPDWRGAEELLTQFLARPADAPGRQAAVALLRQRYGEIDGFNRVWKTAFESWDALARAGAVAPPVKRPAVYAQNATVERAANENDPDRASFFADCDAFVAVLADRYFAVTAAAVREAAPHHLNFGCRFAYVPPPAVLAAAARYLDVISFNCYHTDPRPIVAQYAVTGKPLIVGEFSFRAEDSGLPNTKGAGPKVKTQTERAAAFAQYVTGLLSHPQVVGYHWFQHSDQPQEGRFDGENSNYGIVNGADEVYRELAETMTRINAAAESLHAK